MIPFCRDLGADSWTALTLNLIGNADANLQQLALAEEDHTQVALEIGRLLSSPEFDLKQVEKVLETPVYGTLANDYQAAIASINVGEPLVLSKSQSRIIHDFGSLASKLRFN